MSFSNLQETKSERSKSITYYILSPKTIKPGSLLIAIESPTNIDIKFLNILIISYLHQNICFHK